MLFSKTPRVLLASPTALHPLPRLGAAWGHPKLYLKRDDLLWLGLGGNKVRSIEFWFGEALAQQADLLLVAGLVASNQCRLVAAAARHLDIECHILHNSAVPDELTGNNLLNDLMGVKRVFLGPIDEFERTAKVESYAEELRSQGRRPYIIGDQVIGALGYVNAALEIHAQAEAQRLDIRHLVVAGSGGPTESGLLWGAALLGNSFTVHACSSEYPVPVLKPLMLKIYRGISEKMGFSPSVDPESILNVVDDFLGPGYDIVTPEAIAAVRELAETEGLFIETTYNAKVLATLKHLITSGVIAPDEGVCMIHTGGIPALFGQGERFRSKP